MFNPVVEFNDINQWLDKLKNKSPNPITLTRILSRYLNKRHSLRMKLCVNKEILSRGDFTIGGLYDPSADEINEKSITLYFYINHDAYSPWKLTNKRISLLSLELIETITHEYRHLYQHRCREFLVTKAYGSLAQDKSLKQDQEYLGSGDEIDAYATNIAVRQYLGFNKGHDYNHYIDCFGDHAVTRKLRKKIYLNLSRLTPS